MTIEHRILDAGILCTTDSAGVCLIRLEHGVPTRIRRFTRFIKSALTSSESKIGIEAACLVSLDSISPGSLPRVETGLGQVYLWKDHFCIEWREDSPPRLERRALHARTMLILSNKDKSDPKPTRRLALLNQLEVFLETQSDYADFKPKDRVRQLELDAICWWYQNLPLPLFFHVTGIQPLSAVSRACLASQASHLVPALQDISVDEARDQHVADSCSELLDAMALSTGADKSSILIRQALEHISLLSSETDAMAKRRWVGALLELRMAAIQTGPISSLLLAWAIDLIEAGSIQQPNSPKKTLSTYLKKALEPLFFAFNSLPADLDRWDTELLDEKYRALISAEPTGSQKTMAAALSNFHYFLQTWLDVSPLRKSLRADLPQPEVKAIVIWPTQIERAIDWINALTDDPRLAAAIRVTLHIAKEAPSRATEIAFLRVANILDWGTHIEVEIAPSAKFGRLKSRAAQRRLYLHDPTGMKVIRDWVQHRVSSGLGKTALLFGDPLRPDTVYKRAAMSRCINQLIKSATGNPSASGHSLRHTTISLVNESNLLTSSITDINRFKETAVSAGHVTGATGLIWYTHLYERALRQYVDAALLTLVRLSSEEAGRIVGLNAATLRQEAHRIKSETACYVWKKVREAASHLSAPKATDGIDWIEPTPPQGLTKPSKNFGPAGTLLLLKQLARGAQISDVAASFLLEADDVKRLNTIAIETVIKCGSSIWVRRMRPKAHGTHDLGEALNQFELNLREADQVKFEPLQIFLQKSQNEKVLADAVESWSACRKGLYLSVDQEYAVQGLYQLLATAKLDPTLLRVCLRGQSIAQIDPELKESVQRDFITSFGIKPKLHLAKPRDRVAQAYLQIDSREAKDRPHASSGSISGLDVLMLSIAIHLAWTEGGTS